MTMPTDSDVPYAPLHGDFKGREGAVYHPDPGLLAAANTALLLGTPLLLAGDPGCGKTDFAWYAARALASATGHPDPKANPLEIYVRSDMQARDLLYHYDALARFADAQHAASDDDKGRARDPRHYIRLEGLGLALMSKQQRVVLIDEIDKAPRDLPNDLLRELDQQRFTIPEIPKDLPGSIEDQNELGEKITLTRKMPNASIGAASDSRAKPLVIITSNAERQLPDAFLRRCIFYFIRFPDHAQLVRIVSERNPDLGKPQSPISADDIVTVAEELRAQQLLKRPGTAEILGWATALLRQGSELPGKLVSEIVSAAKRLREADATKSAAPGPKGRPRVEWAKLPRLYCLVKLHEDLISLGCLPKT